jgi:uncharacterized protein
MNHLKDSRSPYLLQHQHNPVHWYEWNKQALERAKDENKLIFLSIGYSSCRWCHVFAHESLEKDDVAKVLNADFISIKVDREERPDIDAVYMQFIQATSGRGGWPLNVFLTPELAPIYGGTYFDRENFLAICQQLSSLWQKDPTKISTQSNRILSYLKEANASQFDKNGQESDIPVAAIERSVAHFTQTFDPVEGGWGGAPKFPRPVTMDLLMHDSRQGASQVLHTLDRMVHSGIWDVLEGGFCRYAVDKAWKVPHFEKMLYDQGQLLSTMANAVRLDPNQQSLVEALQATVNYLRTVLMAPNAGGFYASEDADSLNESGVSTEGAFYVWSYAELREALKPAELQLLSETYSIAPEGNCGDVHDPHGQLLQKNMLHFRRPLQPIPPEQRNVWKQAHAKLQRVRDGRSRPPRDDKIILDWNCLAIRGIMQAAMVVQEASWMQDALRTLDTLRQQFHLGDVSSLSATGRRISFHGEMSNIPLFLSDIAGWILTLLDAYSCTGETRLLAEARNLGASSFVESFFDRVEGRWCQTEGSDPSLLLRLSADHDGAEPGSSSLMVQADLQLWSHTEESMFLERATTALHAMKSYLTTNGAAMPLMVLQAWHLHQITLHQEQVPLSISIVPCLNKNRKNEEELAFTDPLLQALFAQAFLPALAVIHWRRDGADQGMKMVDGKTTLYICAGKECLPPITEVEELLRVTQSDMVKQLFL